MRKLLFFVFAIPVAIVHTSILASIFSWLFLGPIFFMLFSESLSQFIGSLLFGLCPLIAIPFMQLEEKGMVDIEEINFCLHSAIAQIVLFLISVKIRILAGA
jgi:hypothetical protein